MCIPCRKPGDVPIEILNCENIEAGVNFVNLLLDSGCRLFLDDLLDFRTPRSAAQYAAISIRVLQFGTEQGHRGLLAKMKISQVSDCFRGDQWCIAREHNDVFVSGQSVARDHERVTGALLLRLQDEVHACMLESGANTVGFVANNRVHVAGSNNAGSRTYDMLKERHPAHFM